MGFQLELKDVAKNYGSFQAVDRINLQIEKGEIVSLLGASGCGKTTTLRMIAGLIHPTSGRIWIEDRDVTEVPPYRRDIAMVFQNYALFPHLTVYENVVYGLKNKGIKSKTILRKRADEILKIVQLEGVDDRYPKQLSGGQQQRVSLARALIVEPKVMLFDEPLSNLDAKLKLQTRTEIRRLLKEMNVTAVYVTHDQEEALHISDRITVMHAGRIEQITTPKDLYQNPKTAYIADFIGHANLMKAEILEINGDKLTFRNENGDLIVADKPDGDSCRPGEQRTIMVRPENMRLSVKRASEGNRFHGKIRERNFLGSIIRYTVEIGAGMLIEVDAPPESDDWIRDTDEIEILFDQKQVTVFK